MAVRRLHSEQPAGFTFTPENLAWVKQAIAKYPPGRRASAVIPVLWRAQEQNDGWVSEPALRQVADILGMPYIRVYEIATFYTMFQLAPVGRKAHLQICGTTPCMLRGSEDLIEICKRRISDRPHQVSPDGALSWEEVECLGACANAPMLQIGKDTYEDMTPDTMRRLLDGIVRGRPVRPGSLAGRRGSCPEGGQTTLKESFAPDPSWRKRFVEMAAPPQPAPQPAPPPEQKSPAPPKPASQEASPDEKPMVLERARDGQADDLTRIAGIDARIASILNGLGIFHFDQIAAWNETNLRWVDQHLVDTPGRGERTGWVEQAKKLAAGPAPARETRD